MIWLSDFRFPASGGSTGFSEDLACLGLELHEEGNLLRISEAGVGKV